MMNQLITNFHLINYVYVAKLNYLNVLIIQILYDLFQLDYYQYYYYQYYWLLLLLLYDFVELLVENSKLYV